MNKWTDKSKDENYIPLTYFVCPGYKNPIQSYSPGTTDTTVHLPKQMGEHNFT